MSYPSILLAIFAVIVGVQILYYLLFFFRFGSKSTSPKPVTNLKVSVIVCAKNEAHNLKSHLPDILQQDYPNFEVVLVNDSSSDDTLKVMEHFATSHSNVKLVDVKSNETFWGNKKYALTLAIKASTYDYLVFTDADCKPNSKNWLRFLTNHFNAEKNIVLGYGAYAKIKLSFLNKLIRYETVLTALQYVSYANMGIPYMGVGRNMAYKKELFFNNNGYYNHMHIRSGDDDLFINEVADKTNTAVCLDSESFTISEPKRSWNGWFHQKRRHLSTAKYYKPIHKMSLGLFYVSQLLFLLLAPITLYTSSPLTSALALVLFRYGIQITCIAKASKKLNETDIVFITPFLELFLILIQLSIFIVNLISKPRHWK